MNKLSMITTSLALVTTVACHAEHHGHHDKKAKFSVTTPLRQRVEIVKEYVAQVRAIQHIELRALERGYLQGIFVDEGQLVEKGHKMFQIMPLLYQAELQKAEAEAEFTQIEYANTKILADGDVVSPNELALAKAKSNKANAELAIAKVHRGLTEIKAPFGGITGRFEVRLGSLLDEGDLLMTLSDNSRIWVYFNVTESEYLELKSSWHDGPRPVRLAMANGEIFDQPGNIDTIVADFNHETGTIAFRASFPNPNGLLRHGETGKILRSIPLENALLIPQKATFEILDKKFVFVVDEKNVVRSRQITIAEELPHLYVVASGVTASDKLLLEGLRKVKDGSEIELDYQEPADVVARLEVPAE